MRLHPAGEYSERRSKRSLYEIDHMAPAGRLKSADVLISLNLRLVVQNRIQQ
jgi:hypothetical protein